MTSAAPLLRPLPGERGLASYDVEFLAERVGAAWAGLSEVAGGTDPDAPSRLPDWNGHDVLVHLGSWPEQPVLAGLIAAAEAGSPTGARPLRTEQDAHNQALVSRHRGASEAEVMAALAAGRDSTLGFLASERAQAIGQRLVDSMLGPLPLLGVVFASTYELAVHAGDLAPCGAPAPPPSLLDAGLAALVDVTGALAAGLGLDAAAAAVTPDGGWAFAASGADWTVAELEPGAPPPAGAAVEGTARILLDVSAGRTSVPPLLVSRQLRVHDVAGMLALAPILEAVPGLPGGAGLRVASRYLAGAGRLARLWRH